VIVLLVVHDVGLGLLQQFAFGHEILLQSLLVSFNLCLVDVLVVVWTAEKSLLGVQLVFALCPCTLQHRPVSQCQLVDVQLLALQAFDAGCTEHLVAKAREQTRMNAFKRGRVARELRNLIRAEENQAADEVIHHLH